jgi:hypothetical protein
MRPGLAKIIGKVPISPYFESAETDHHIAENACGIISTDIWSSKRVHSVSKIQNLDRNTTNYGCDNGLELNTGVAQPCLPIG